MKTRVAALGVGAITAALLAVMPVTAAANHSVPLLVTSGGPGSCCASFGGFEAGLSEDGSHAFFLSAASLVPGDTDGGAIDIYQRAGGVLSLVSTGPMSAGLTQDTARFSGASADGTYVWWLTRERLVTDDTDDFFDLYERHAGQTTLTSEGSINANTPTHKGFAGASPDGSRVFFTSFEKLTPQDQDDCFDIYERSGGTTTLFTDPHECSTGLGAAGAYTRYVDAPGGPLIYLSTSERLTSDDTNPRGDVFVNEGGAFHLLSSGPAGPGQDWSVDLEDVSPDGQYVLMSTGSTLTADDADLCPGTLPCLDLYVAHDGTLRRVSKGPVGGNGPFNAPDDSWASGVAVLDNGKVFFGTREQLTADDTDQRGDIYEYDWATDATRLVSAGLEHPGDNGLTIGYEGSSADGTRVFFTSNEQLLPDDLDSAYDIYERHAGTTTLASPNQPGGPVLNDGSSFRAVSDDGRRVFFETRDSILPADPNALEIYERFDGTYYQLVPHGTDPDQFANGFYDATSDGSKVLFRTGDSLVPEDTNGVADAYVITQSNTYARPKAATPIKVPFVPAYQPCGAPNRAHAEPLSFGSCNPPAQTSPYLTLGTPDANGQPAKSVGNLKLQALVDNPSTPADEADARYAVQVSDVRNSAGLTDHTGALLLNATIKVTDRNSPDLDGGSPNATGTPIAFPVTVPCTATADTTVGSDCAVVTTANTIAPGAAVGGKRAIWETGQVQVRDGGADGNPATSDGDSLFLVQGVFIP